MYNSCMNIDLTKKAGCHGKIHILNYILYDKKDKISRTQKMYVT